MRKLLGLLFISSSLLASEGKWTPQQVLQLDPKWLAEQGLELPPSRLWDAQRGTGLLAATIGLPGCSGAWISADGLFITNHHCVFSALQEHSTPQNNILENGFLARTRDAELRGKTARVTIPRRFTDVTSEVLSGAAPASGAGRSAAEAAAAPPLDDLLRFRAIEQKTNEIVARCEQQPGFRCKVAAHDGGLQYVLQETSELADVRLVYAPPRAVGEFGGEIDNWMWPRHTGDFAIGRAYVDGKPFRPEFFFPLAKQGVKPGDFIMVLGYPGTTYRSFTAGEMEERHIWFTARANVYRDWIRIMEEAAKGNAAGELAISDAVKTLANRQKNGEGQLAGFKRGSILENQRAADRTVLTAFPAAKAPYDGLAALAAEKKAGFDRNFLLDHIRMTPASLTPTGPRALVWAVAIAKSALERQKPDAERDPVFMQRSIGRVREQLERDEKRFFLAADKALTADFFRRLRHPERSEGSQNAKPSPPRSFGVFAPQDDDVDHLYAKTKMLDLAERLKMFGETPEQLRARRDPLVDLGFALAKETDALRDRSDRWDGAISRLRPEWRRAVIAHAGRPVAPDGNSTLRVSFGHVQGYAPRDGVWYVPQTTLAGMVAKHTDEEPFDVPDRILAAAPKNPTLPIAFLADADTTGGNSGSPAVNGRGELVGVNFDRVWENVSNDFAFYPPFARNVSADVRYMLWLLDEVEDAKELLKELGIH